MYWYYGITIAVNLILAVVFRKNIYITELSFIPLFLIALMIFQAAFFKNEKAESGFRTTYGSSAIGSELTDEEQNELQKVWSEGLVVAIPWMIPFVIFFSSPVKLFSVLVYLIGLTGGLGVYKWRNKRKILQRMNNEDRERKEQEKKEELGND